MNFNIITLGCKVNQYESQAMSEMLINNGYTPSNDPQHADITVINSCTVTAVSDAKNRKLIRRARRLNPQGVIVLTGCMPQAFPNRSRDFQDCDIVLGNKCRRKLINVLDDFLRTRTRIVSIEEYDSRNTSYENIQVSNFQGHTRAFVKIEDGCNRFCSYCIIPYSRGRVRSKGLAELKEEITALADNGYREIVLVGINLSAYGQDIDKNLADAVEAVCSVDKIRRVRLGSFEPEMMYPRLIKRLASQPKLCPHFHLSLQSGCDETLKRMHRRYDTGEYMAIVNALRAEFTNPSITTDIMVGFPGETSEEFNKSLDFVKSVGFSKAHIFPYSRRKGTVADKMENQIDEKTKVARSKIMIKQTELDRKRFLRSQVGLTESLLVERLREGGYFEGYTKNYIPVRIYTNRDITAGIVDVKITDCSEDYCVGELI